MWLDHTLAEVFGVTEPLSASTADATYDHLVEALATDAFRPRALYERFGIEFLATTDGALDPLDAHAEIAASGWGGRVVPTFRPDDVVDPDRPDFQDNLGRLADLTGEDTDVVGLPRRVEDSATGVHRRRRDRHGPRPPVGGHGGPPPA